MAISASVELQNRAPTALLRTRIRLGSDDVVRDSFIEAFNPNRTVKERRALTSGLEIEAQRQIAAFASSDKSQLYEYDISRGPASHLKTDRMTLDRNPNPGRLTFARLLEGNVPREVLDLPKDTIVIPIMTGGMLLASGIMSAMQSAGSAPKMAMIGYPKTDRFWDGSKPVPKEILVAPETLRLLRKNADKTALIVDDVIQDGVTIKKVREFLSGLGFSDVRQLIFYSPNRKYPQGKVVNQN
jgi:hypoxanthine-guanine phosphoribosyltransferase